MVPFVGNNHSNGDDDADTGNGTASDSVSMGEYRFQTLLSD